MLVFLLQILQLKTLLAKFKQVRHEVKEGERENEVMVSSLLLQSCPREWEKIVGGEGKAASKVSTGCTQALGPFARSSWLLVGPKG